MFLTPKKKEEQQNQPLFAYEKPEGQMFSDTSGQPVVRAAPTQAQIQQQMAAADNGEKGRLAGGTQRYLESIKDDPRYADVYSEATGIYTPEQQAQRMWADIMKGQQANLDQSLAGIGAQQSLYGRRAAEMNASLGRGVGGGFAAGQAQAQLGAQQLELDVRSEHAKRGLELQMTQLKELQERAREDRDYVREQELTREAAFRAGILTMLNDPNIPPNLKSAMLRTLQQGGDMSEYAGMVQQYVTSKQPGGGGFLQNLRPSPPQNTRPFVTAYQT
jgi:hypothetical protein